MGQYEPGAADISIHSPREGRDGNGDLDNLMRDVFQSTRPVRGETFASEGLSLLSANFNPLAP